MQPNMTVVYVRDMDASLAFYRDVFGIPSTDPGPTFSQFRLESGHTFAIWLRPDVTPATTPRAELVTYCGTRATVDEEYARLKGLSVPIAEEVQVVEFGYTFAVTDPDGHLIRVMAE
jgi:catechol 2,3-dioxygenase-like lactoylglutathione lyase family enzyme